MSKNYNDEFTVNYVMCKPQVIVTKGSSKYSSKENKVICKDMIDMKQKKKDMLVEFLKLGMDFDSACLAAEIDDDFKKELQYDDAFTHLANTAIAKKEVELLQKLEQIGEANAQRGESKQIERQLELLNPERYSKVTKLSHSMNSSGSSGGKITVSFEGDDKEE